MEILQIFFAGFWHGLIEWNGYETRQTPLLYVFVDLKVHNVQKNSYHFDCIDQ